MKRIGCIGLGIMGGAMARNLLRSGFEVAVWNRTRSRAEGLLAEGATWAGSAGKLAAQVEVVCVNVTDTSDVESVLFGERGVVEGLGSGGAEVVIDHSTISPAATREFAQRLKTAGADLLDAPVSGGDVGARAGTLSVMVGGDQAVFERCRSILEAVGRTITFCGPTGSGQVTKACNQVLCAVNLVGVCEAMALARREGLDLERMLAVTTAGAAGSWSLANLGPQIARGDLSPGFMIDLINKDLGIVADEAHALELSLPGTALGSELLREAASEGLGRSGTQALCRVYEKRGGFKYVET